MRKFITGEEEALWQLFFQTVRTINLGDYTEQQVSVWAPDQPDWERWRERIRRNDPYVCVHEDRIVGFADLQVTGYIDQFFVHCQWQGRGVGSRLMTQIEEEARGRRLAELFSNVSITAKPFFESRGFSVAAAQQVAVGTVMFDNFKMVKPLGAVHLDAEPSSRRATTHCSTGEGN